MGSPFCTHKSVQMYRGLKYQGTEFEFTVVQKLNQGNYRKPGVSFSGLLLLLFGEAKSKYRNVYKRKRLLVILIVKQIKYRGKLILLQHWYYAWTRSNNKWQGDPHHQCWSATPATHGVLHLVITLNGETIKSRTSPWLYPSSIENVRKPLLTASSFM